MHLVELAVLCTLNEVSEQQHVDLHAREPWRRNIYIHFKMYFLKSAPRQQSTEYEMCNIFIFLNFIFNNHKMGIKSTFIMLYED